MADPSRKSYRVGVIGFAHMHVNDLVDRFAATGRAKIIACADTVPRTPSRITVEGSRNANLARALAGPDRPRKYDDYRDMLATEQLDIAIFCPEIARHAEIAEAVAAVGIHMVTEKPMAGTLQDAHRMAQAAKAAGVALAVNWPITWRPAIRRAKELLDAGAIGEVWQLKWRNGPSLGPLAHGSTHPGNTVIGLVSNAEKAMEWWHQTVEGGGALLDYCCYGACLASWYLGTTPITVQGMTANLMSPFGDAEDNATILLRYPAAIAILEASWTTFHSGIPNGPIIYGTHGTIVVDGADILIYRERGATTPNLVEKGDPLPQGRATIAEEFLHHLETGDPLHPTLDLKLNLDAVAILDAGIRSAESGIAQPLPRAEAGDTDMVVRIASIGYGDIAQRRHFPLLQALGGRAELAAIAGRDPARLAVCAERFAVPRHYTDPAEMLADPTIDAVLVLTPPDSHAVHAEMAVRAGKHVLIEKPLVPTPQEATRLRAAVRAQQAIKPVTVFPLPHVATAEHALVADLLQAGAIGTVTLVESHRGHRGPTHADWFYRKALSGGGVLLDLGIYQLTALATLFGPATAVTASITTRFETRTMDDGTVVRPDVEDSALLSLVLEGGIAASVNATWNGSLSHHATRIRTVVIGREGILHFGVADGAVYLFRPDGDYAHLPAASDRATFDGQPCRRFQPEGTSTSIIAAFIAAIETGDTSTRNLDIQAHVLDIVAQAYAGP